jgi:hypothetical protein
MVFGCFLRHTIILPDCFFTARFGSNLPLLRDSEKTFRVAIKFRKSSQWLGAAVLLLAVRYTELSPGPVQRLLCELANDASGCAGLPSLNLRRQIG